MERKATAAGGSLADRPQTAAFIITREFNAPRERVFKAWTEAGQLMRWWGPRNFTIPFCKVDPRPGGIFHFCMRSPEGKDYWGKGIYREVAAPERLVYTDSFSNEKGDFVEPSQYGMAPDWPAETLITVTFEEQGNKTKLTLNGGVTAELAKKHMADQGWNESFDRLEEYLKKVRLSGEQPAFE